MRKTLQAIVLTGVIVCLGTFLVRVHERSLRSMRSARSSKLESGNRRIEIGPHAPVFRYFADKTKQGFLQVAFAKIVERDPHRADIGRKVEGLSAREFTQTRWSIETGEERIPTTEIDLLLRTKMRGCTEDDDDDEVIIIVRAYIPEDETIINGDLVPANSLKISIEIVKWNFCGTSNRLDFVFGLEGKNLKDDDFSTIKNQAGRLEFDDVFFSKIGEQQSQVYIDLVTNEVTVSFGHFRGRLQYESTISEPDDERLVEFGESKLEFFGDTPLFKYYSLEETNEYVQVNLARVIEVNAQGNDTYRHLDLPGESFMHTESTIQGDKGHEEVTELTFSLDTTVTDCSKKSEDDVSVTLTAFITEKATTVRGVSLPARSVTFALNIKDWKFCDKRNHLDFRVEFEGNYLSETPLGLQFDGGRLDFGKRLSDGKKVEDDSTVSVDLGMQEGIIRIKQFRKELQYYPFLRLSPS
eukprot:gb/GECG01010765.1/.p1 GENE.gb/GECG01010765.1/~~gb/GECG01010765.1/.p1  ORF type:complete len:469 (+),score=59.82 gb/GECG01010765.1/:1-1407(+)